MSEKSKLSDKTFCEDSEFYLTKCTEILNEDVKESRKSLDRLRRLHFGNDIVEYLKNINLKEPKYEYTAEKFVNQTSEMLKKQKSTEIENLQKKAEMDRHLEEEQMLKRNEQIWYPAKVYPMENLEEKGHTLIIEPLEVEREKVLQQNKLKEQEIAEWEMKESQVQPYIDEIAQHGTPTHGIQSEFWSKLLGEDIFNINIKVVDKDEKQYRDIDVDNYGDTGTATKLIVAKLSDKDKLKRAAKAKREEELRQIEVRNEKRWHPQKANFRVKYQNIFNKPKAEIKVIPGKKMERELTLFEKNQILVKSINEHEKKLMSIRRENMYTPGKIADITEIDIPLKPNKVDINKFENKEYGRFLERLNKERYKEEIERIKWRNVINPGPYQFGEGKKIFKGFNPQIDDK